MKGKLNQAIRTAFERGYRVDARGRVVSPFGQVRSCYVKRTSDSGYAHCTFNIRIGQKVYPVPFARLAAYQKFGERALGSSMVVRHCNDRSLDNRPANLAIGTRSQNALDVPKAKRIARARAGGKASARARK